MKMQDKIKADIAEKKRKEITDFRHTKPCGTCGSTHGCNCQADANRQATREYNELGMY